jgi:hypothetical protein
VLLHTINTQNQRKSQNLTEPPVENQWVGEVDAYYTDPLNIIQDKTSIPKANGKRHYLVPTDFPSVYNGHSMDNVLKNFGVKPDKYNKE